MNYNPQKKHNLSKTKKNNKWQRKLFFTIKWLKQKKFLLRTRSFISNLQ